MGGRDAKSEQKMADAGRLRSSKRRNNPTRKDPLQFPLQSRKILSFLASRKPKVSLSRSTKRRRSDSNRCIKVLQTSPLPLGYGAITQDGCHYNQTVVGS